MTTTLESPVESPRLAALIRHEVGWHLDTLEVLVQRGGVVLRGHTRCAFARSRAAHEAERLSGVPVLANEIRVE